MALSDNTVPAVAKMK